MSKTKLNVADSVTPNVEMAPVSTDRKALGKQKLEKFMKEELKNVKGIFQFFEAPGQSATITVRKYPGHFFSKSMQDGQEYEIPLYVARFLNGIDVTAEGINGKLNTCGYTIKQYQTEHGKSSILDSQGNPILGEKIKRRFGFQSMEFAGAA